MPLRVAAVVWGVALLAALSWPGRIIGPLDGAPFELPAKALLFGVVLPALWWFHPAFLRTVSARAIVAVLLGWKLLAWALIPQGGWCGEFLTKYPPQIGGYRLASSWDIRTIWQSPPTCTAIVARGYPRLTQFPAWIINIPYGTDWLDGTTPDAALDEPRRPPDGEYAMYVHGSMETVSPGTLSVVTGPDVRLSGTVDAQRLAAERGETAAAQIGSGSHWVALRLDLTGRNWAFTPLWNGADLFSAVATATTPITRLQRLVLQVGRWITPILIFSLFALWLSSAAAAYHPPAVMLMSVAALALTTAFLASGGAESRVARWAVAPLAACLVIPVPPRLRNARGAWLLVGVPWLALISALAFRSIGGFRLYFPGDDSLTYQRFAYRIFMEGFWLEGGQTTFWNQPLYRWICGVLHLVFGDSSVGEMLWDAVALLIGAMFAFHVVKAIAGFRAGIGAAICVLLTVMLGPSWYLLGRGLPEISASLWIYLAAFCLIEARRGSIPDAILAGLFGVLAFYTRLNHLLLVFALVGLTLDDDILVTAVYSWRTLWRQLPKRIAGVYVVCLLAGVLAFALRTWHYTGEFSVFAGTTRTHNATGLGLGVDSLWSPGVWRNAIESVLMIVTVQDPPRFDWRSILVVAGVIASLLGLLGVPVARRLPLGLVVMCLGAIAGGLVARGVAYPSRFSIHLIPVAVAASISVIALVRPMVSWRSGS